MNLDGLTLDFQPSRPGGTNGVFVATLGSDTFTESLNIAKSKVRERIATKLGERWPTLQDDKCKAELIGKLERLAAQCLVQDKAVCPNGAKDESKSSEKLLASMPKDLRDEADAMLSDPNLFKRVLDDIADLGVAGERELTGTIYLAGVSRNLDKPISVRVHGPSSSGKSHLIQQTTRLFPPEAVIQATQLTPQALYHMPPGSLVHKWIVAGERSRLENDESAEATRALREMLSGGRLSKLMPVKVEGGQIETRLIEQDGPIAYIESTTLAKVDTEDANRCIMLHTDERPEQTRRIIKQLAPTYNQRNGAAAAERIMKRHHAIQRMLKPKTVIIPFAERVGELLRTESVQARRAFPQLMSMVEASALLHQRQRQLDIDCRIFAIAEDYQLARHLLLKPMMKQLGGGLSDPARRFLERLQGWAHDTFTSTEAKKHETGSRSAVYGWLHELQVRASWSKNKPGADQLRRNGGSWTRALTRARKLSCPPLKKYLARRRMEYWRQLGMMDANRIPLGRNSICVHVAIWTQIGH